MAHEVDIPNAAPTPFGHIVHENVLALVVLWTNLILYRMYCTWLWQICSVQLCVVLDKKRKLYFVKVLTFDLHKDTLWSLFIFISQCPLSCMLVIFFSWWHPYACGLLICQCPIWIHLLLMCLRWKSYFVLDAESLPVSAWRIHSKFSVWHSIVRCG